MTRIQWLCAASLACAPAGDGVDRDDRVAEVLALDPDIDAGGAVYAANCASCHGAEGEGGTGPSFVDRFAEIHEAGHSWESEQRLWVATILQGEGAMPGWGAELEQQDVSDVLAFVHETWGVH
jgi:mono/diheme cytochrome c family protein